MAPHQHGPDGGDGPGGEVFHGVVTEPQLLLSPELAKRRPATGQHGAGSPSDDRAGAHGQAAYGDVGHRTRPGPCRGGRRHVDVLKVGAAQQADAIEGSFNVEFHRARRVPLEAELLCDTHSGDRLTEVFRRGSVKRSGTSAAQGGE